MQECGQLPDVQTYAVLIAGLCNSQQISTAIELLREMEANKLELNIVIYTVIIEGLCKAGEFQSARDVFFGLSSKGFRPDVRTYTIMINGLCDEGLLDEAEKKWMRRAVLQMIAPITSLSEGLSIRTRHQRLWD
ncbi:hypothetical protein ABKV19_003484 [Rosa sericea]